MRLLPHFSAVVLAVLAASKDKAGPPGCAGLFQSGAGLRPLLLCCDPGGAYKAGGWGASFPRDTQPSRLASAVWSRITAAAHRPATPRKSVKQPWAAPLATAAASSTGTTALHCTGQERADENRPLPASVPAYTHCSARFLQLLGATTSPSEALANAEQCGVGCGSRLMPALRSHRSP